MTLQMMDTWQEHWPKDIDIKLLEVDTKPMFACLSHRAVWHAIRELQDNGFRGHQGRCVGARRCTS